MPIVYNHAESQHNTCSGRIGWSITLFIMTFTFSTLSIAGVPLSKATEKGIIIVDGKLKKPGSLRGLNPQPEPPTKNASSNKGNKFKNPGALRGFNPQPEPPAKKSSANKGNKFKNPGAIRGFNPQPEPPAKKSSANKGNKFKNPGAIRGFNPQPEPPAIGLPTISR